MYIKSSFTNMKKIIVFLLVSSSICASELNNDSIPADSSVVSMVAGINGKSISSISPFSRLCDEFNRAIFHANPPLATKYQQIALRLGDKGILWCRSADDSDWSGDKEVLPVEELHSIYQSEGFAKYIRRKKLQEKHDFFRVTLTVFSLSFAGILFGTSLVKK